MQDDSKNLELKDPGHWFVVGWLLAILILVGATAGLVLAHDRQLTRAGSQLAQQVAAGPHVLVEAVGQTPSIRKMQIPATTRGFDETNIYAKVPGYMKEIRVDKGDRVRAGEIIATIESPETDKQVANYRANYQLAVITEQRDKQLVAASVIAQQDYDNQHAATLQAKATLEQYLELQRYEIIRAPYDGIVTARYADPGHLVPEATSATSTTDAIVAIARLAPLRVFAYVPQDVAPFIKNGDHAAITFIQYPQRVFSGSITRHPEALAPDSRTMLVEVDLPNEEHALYPGMYGMAQFSVAITAGAPLVPDDALIFRDNKIYVPVVRDKKLHLAEVALGYDNGVASEVTSGVDVNDLVAVNVGQAARDGERVQPVFAANQPNQAHPSSVSTASAISATDSTKDSK